MFSSVEPEAGDILDCRCTSSLETGINVLSAMQGNEWYKSLFIPLFAAGPPPAD